MTAPLSAARGGNQKSSSFISLRSSSSFCMARSAAA
jgi:hypothetical protein